MQTLYAFKDDNDQTFNDQQQFLLESMNGMYDLYLLMLSMLTEVQLKAKDHLNKIQQKHLATEEDKNPNTKFVNNHILNLLGRNEELKDEVKKRKLDTWKLDDEYVDVIFRELISSELYKSYMINKQTTFNIDREFVIEFYKTIIAPNDKLFDYFEDKKLTWIDDLPVVNTSILKLLRKAHQDIPQRHFLPKLFKDGEDKAFGLELLEHTLKHNKKYDTIISEKTQNWDKERITTIDLVLLEMAICEIEEFPSIPVKVTMNEYLEVAKEYSTPKSNVFINGILDKLVKEYTDKGTLNKAGRGLL